MARFSWAGAEKDFEIVLSKHSSNVIALMGKGGLMLKLFEFASLTNLFPA
jgi:hypothetical protein